MTLIHSEKHDWKTIWEEFRKGDKGAFQKMYNAFLDKLFAYGSKLTSNTSVVEDSIQELFLEMYTHRKNLSETDNLEYYLLKGLRRIIFHRLRKENRFHSLEDDNTAAQNIVFEIEENTPVDFKEEKIERVKRLLSALSPKNREILYLKFYQGLSYHQIGEMLKIKPDSVKKQVYRVMSGLKDHVKNKLWEFFLLCFRA
jgi:RNA polymerase sigma factor (sigma-70 family)